MNIFTVGFKSLLSRRKQYTSLFLVCAFGVAVSLFCLFLVKGMLGTLEHKARIYYGGDMLFFGGKNNFDMSNAESFVEKLEPVFPKGSIITKRFDFDADYAAFYFEGTGVRQRIIKGVDFSKEQRLFSQFNYVEGSASEMKGENGVLLSAPIAQMLEVHVGDEITLMLKNIYGYTNTVQLIVKGIFKDSSLFGMYTSYMDLHCLLSAYGYSEDYANRICIDLPAGETLTEKKLEHYQSELEKQFNMFKLVEDKQTYYDSLLTGKFSEPTYALIKLNANLQDLKVLIDAMKGIVGFVIVMLIVIIVAGVSSTYRVIIMKRINEIGIYMAIGIKDSKILFMLLSEVLFLIISGCVVGLGISVVLCGIIKLFNFSFIPAFDIFLAEGSLQPMVSVSYFFILSAIVIVTTLVAVLFAVYKSVSITPVKALETTE